MAQVCEGRRVGGHLSSRDTLSAYAQRRQGFFVERLDHFDETSGEWQEVLVEDRRASPADLAAIRLDFASWLRRLPTRGRRIALSLAAGNTTAAVARKFRLSPGRISQLRSWLRTNWEEFQGPGSQRASACG